MRKSLGIVGLIIASAAYADDLNIPEVNTPPYALYKGVVHDEQVLSRSANPPSYWFSIDQEREYVLFHSRNVGLAALLAPGDSVEFRVRQDLYGRPINTRGIAIDVDPDDLLSVNGKALILQKY